MTFVASRLEMIEGSPTYVPHELSDELSVSNSSGFRILQLMKIQGAGHSGAITLDQAIQGAEVALAFGEAFPEERRRLRTIDEIAVQGRRVGATHLSWA